MHATCGITLPSHRQLRAHRRDNMGVLSKKARQTWWAPENILLDRPAEEDELSGL